jgi:hypothetical protein
MIVNIMLTKWSEEARVMNGMVFFLDSYSQGQFLMFTVDFWPLENREGENSWLATDFAGPNAEDLVYDDEVDPENVGYVLAQQENLQGEWERVGNLFITERSAMILAKQICDYAQSAVADAEASARAMFQARLSSHAATLQFENPASTS